VDDEILFSGLKAATQSAQLSGYLQDLLLYTTNGEALAKAPAIARERAPTCDICGSHSFKPGPRERLTNGRPPQCRECGSLERHRVVHKFISELDRSLTSNLDCISIREKIQSGISIFRRYSHFDIASDNDNDNDTYNDNDLIISTNLLHPNDYLEWYSTLEQALQHIREDGIFVIISDFGIEYDNILDCFICEALPKTHHEVNYVSDNATGALFSTLFVSGKFNFATNSLLSKMRGSALKMMSSIEVSTSFGTFSDKANPPK
jgi:hypothetical protein